MNETQEKIIEIARRIQRIDTQIEELKADRKQILKDAKSDGINTTILNKAIRQIRAEKKQDPAKKTELEIYIELLEDIVEPVDVE